MDSILIIEKNYKFDPQLQVKLEKENRLYFAKDIHDAIEIIEEHYIDIFVIMSETHIDLPTEKFLQTLYETRPIITPIIFIAENPDETLYSKVSQTGGWYLLKFPIDRHDFLNVVQNITEIANLIEVKNIQILKNGAVFPYSIKDIIRIERSRNKHINVFSHGLKPGTEEVNEFFYAPPLAQFISDHNLGRWVKKAHQSWLVKVSEIKEVRPTEMVLILKNGKVIPTSRRHINTFRPKKTKKDK